jgi:hypothetical protein
MAVGGHPEVSANSALWRSKAGWLLTTLKSLPKSFAIAALVTTSCCIGLGKRHVMCQRGHDRIIYQCQYPSMCPCNTFLIPAAKAA